MILYFEMRSRKHVEFEVWLSECCCWNLTLDLLEHFIIFNGITLVFFNSRPER